MRSWPRASSTSRREVRHLSLTCRVPLLAHRRSQHHRPSTAAMPMVARRTDAGLGRRRTVAFAASSAWAPSPREEFTEAFARWGPRLRRIGPEEVAGVVFEAIRPGVIAKVDRGGYLTRPVHGEAEDRQVRGSTAAWTSGGRHPSHAAPGVRAGGKRRLGSSIPFRSRQTLPAQAARRSV